jgi:hypothetical protein
LLCRVVVECDQEIRNLKKKLFSRPLLSTLFMHGLTVCSIAYLDAGKAGIMLKGHDALQVPPSRAYIVYTTATTEWVLLTAPGTTIVHQ